MTPEEMNEIHQFARVSAERAAAIPHFQATHGSTDLAACRAAIQVYTEFGPCPLEVRAGGRAIHKLKAMEKLREVWSSAQQSDAMDVKFSEGRAIQYLEEYMNDGHTENAQDMVAQRKEQQAREATLASVDQVAAAEAVRRSTEHHQIEMSRAAMARGGAIVNKVAPLLAGGAFGYAVYKTTNSVAQGVMMFAGAAFATWYAMLYLQPDPLTSAALYQAARPGSKIPGAY